MLKLIITTFIWAFSFSLIGNYIVGKMDTYVAIFIRFLIAAIVFIPFLNLRKVLAKEGLIVAGIGALQVGVMYIFYFNSFRFLSVVEVALFTVTTPLYISLIGSLVRRDFKVSQLFNVLLVVLGAAILKWNSISNQFVLGFLLVQGANLSFALGQILYKKFAIDLRPREIFSLFYSGALIPIAILVLMYSKVELEAITNTQWGVLIWLGIVASGVGYYLWNSGAKEVSYDLLAVLNNLVIPIAIIVNIIFWDKQIEWLPFLSGASLIVIGVVLEKKFGTSDPQ